MITNLILCYSLYLSYIILLICSSVCVPFVPVGSTLDEDYNNSSVFNKMFVMYIVSLFSSIHPAIFYFLEILVFFLTFTYSIFDAWEVHLMKVYV